MRRFAPLIALVIAAIIVGIGWNFWTTKLRQDENSPAASSPLSDELIATREGWEWSYTEAGKPVVEVRAKDMKSVKAPSVMELIGVEMKLFHQDGKVFDQVVSPRAQFAANDGKLYSDAEVGITMGLSADDAPPGRLVTIKSSGVSFEKDTGRAETERHATFVLDVGEGEAEGASYDPQTRELRLKSKVKLIWRGKDLSSAPMHIEAGELLYREVDQKVFLSPWSKFSRNNLKMSGGSAVITLEDGNIRLVDTVQASGADEAPGRKVEFGADQLQLLFRDKGLMEKITGQENARLASISSTTKTSIRSKRLDLSFKESNGAAELTNGLAQGSSVAETEPVLAQATAASIPPPTRVLKSEVIEMRMKDGGQDIDEVATHTPGVLDFIPNHVSQRKRHMEGDRLTMLYAEGNVLRTFRSTMVKTRTEPEPASRMTAKGKQQKKIEPQLTSSDQMVAQFDPKTGEMTGLEQWGKFRYQEADRRARSERAVLEQQKNLITLTGDARVWDATGATDADSIVINQADGQMIAKGNVRTVREPDNSDEDKIHATAKQMTTSSDNTKIGYEGNAVLWQGENRLKADRIAIDRTAQNIVADGKITNTLKNDDQPVTTIVRSDHMTYSDKDKVAFYEGKVNLVRPQLNVKSDRLRAYLSKEEDSASQGPKSTLPKSGLDRAFAEGSVEILQSEQDRSRFGTGNSAEYYIADSKVILEGNRAQLTEKQSGSDPTKTEGQKLTWFGVTDKLLVDGAVTKPAITTLRRKNNKK